jgi:hypothetical protein
LGARVGGGPLDRSARVIEHERMLHGCSRSWVSFGLLVVLAGGCRPVTAEQVASWKGSDEGRERLVTALRDEGVPLAVRAQAGAALAEVGWFDRLESALAGMPFDGRARLIPAIVPLVAPSLDAPDQSKAHDAREALFSLRRQATTDEGTKAVDAALVPALERELRAGRGEGGGHSAKEMLLTYGAAAAPVALRVLDDVKAPYDTAVEIIDKVGDQAARDQGSSALVKRARAASPTPAPLRKALSKLSGAPAIAFLEEKIEQGAPQEKLDAAATLGECRLDKTVVPFAVKVAKDRSNTPALREQLVAVLEKLPSDEARLGLVQLIEADPDPAFRYRAFAAVVKSGSGRTVRKALEAFPASISFRPDEVREKLVAPIASLGFRGREETFQSLDSKAPLARMVAIWTLEKAGFGGDAKQLDKHTADKGRVKGITPTVGAEAARAAAALKGKGSG